MLVKSLKLILLLIISFQLMSLTFLFCAPAGVQAAALNLQVPLTGLGESVTLDNTTAPIAKYVKAIYTYGIGAVGILAAVVLMIGGIMWITAGGNASSIGEAKSMIAASLTGLVLALTSYLLLSQVNPALVNLQSSVINSPGAVSISTITAIDTGCISTDLSYDPLSAATLGAGTAPTCESKNSEGWVAESNTKLCANYVKGQTCCCPPIPTDCPQDRTINCKACLTCSDIKTAAGISCKNNSSCRASSAMLSELYKVAIAADNSTDGPKTNEFQITEAWPPTVYHVAKGHTDGNCVDIAFKNHSTDINDTKKLYNILQKGGFSQILYECYQSSGCCNSYVSSGINCSRTDTGYSAGAANHFHVCIK